MSSASSSHNCLDAVQCFIGLQQQTIANLQDELRRIRGAWVKREKLLTDRVTNLEWELGKVRCNSGIRPRDANLLTFELTRIDGSLGFSLSGNGGEKTEESCDGGLFVSRIVVGGSADKKLEMNDQVIEVNGQDLSKASHEEAVEAFRVAHEPIVVEVLRRNSSLTSPSKVPPASTPAISSPSSSASSSTVSSVDGKSPPSSILADAQTQTEWDDAGWEQTAAIFNNSIGDSSANSFADADESSVRGPDDSMDDLRQFDFEYEEVTLSRMCSGDRLGLTLCYGSGEDVETDIFISEIDPFGIAARDGRIREGDQLLQVNGVDVHTRNKAIALLSCSSSENKMDNDDVKPEVTLLVARPQIQVDDFLDEDDVMDPVSGLQVHREEDELGLSDDDVVDERRISEKDSGVCRTEKQTGATTTDSEGSVGDREVALLSREMSSITVDAEATLNSSSAYNTGGESCRSTPLTLELAATRPPPPPLSATEDKGTQLTVDSDAYSVLSCESCRRCLRLATPPVSSPAKSTGKSIPGRSTDSERNRNYVTLVPRETVYTTETHLAHTMWLQQQLLRQALQRQVPPSWRLAPPPTQMKQPGVSVHPPPLPERRPVNEPPSTPASGDQMEWKVKRRADGSRYIARRPVRNRLLKERAHRLLEERTLTTDDETASELKCGRYWSKEERKRHLERARDQKRKREMILRMRNSSSGGTGGHLESPCGGSGSGSINQSTDPIPPPPPPPHILELSQRKMARKKGRSLFDDFTTVQEVLAHGSRGPSGPSKALGLLSVTTV